MAHLPRVLIAAGGGASAAPLPAATMGALAPAGLLVLVTLGALTEQALRR